MKCLRFKAPILAFLSDGRRWFSIIASNFPFASGVEDLTSGSYAGVVNGDISTEKTFTQFDRAHAALNPSKKSLSTRYEMVKNMKTLPPSSVGNDDDFSELGPLSSSQTNSNDILPQQKHEGIETKERVVAAHRVPVGNYSLDAPEYFIVRISNISMATTEPSIYSICITCGYVAALSRTKEGAAEVVFKVKGKVAAEDVVKHLSNISADGCQWSAKLLPGTAENSSNDPASSKQVGSKISNLLWDFRKKFNMQRIYLEDLEDLHHAILHLRDQSDAPNSAS